MDPFANPNDDRRTPVNNMIKKLLKLRLTILLEHTPVTKKSTGGYHIISRPSEAELDYEAEGEAKMVTVNKLIAELENIAY